MREPIDLDEAIQKAKEATAAVTLATGFYPRKDLRENRPRSRSKQRALILAVCDAVQKARESGFLVKTENGYEMKW